MARLSVKVVFNGRNDMLTAGRKFSGNAVYMDGDRVCQHGTILVSSDIGKMAHYLTPKESKLARNHIKSVSSRVVNLCQMNKAITVDQCKRAIIEEVGAAPFQGGPCGDEVDRLEAFYRNEDWIYHGK